VLALGSTAAGTFTGGGSVDATVLGADAISGTALEMLAAVPGTWADAETKAVGSLPAGCAGRMTLAIPTAGSALLPGAVAEVRAVFVGT
jgi:hypothetical protein